MNAATNASTASATANRFISPGRVTFRVGWRLIDIRVAWIHSSRKEHLGVGLLTHGIPRWYTPQKGVLYATSRRYHRRSLFALHAYHGSLDPGDDGRRS